MIRIGLIEPLPALLARQAAERGAKPAFRDGRCRHHLRRAAPEQRQPRRASVRHGRRAGDRVALLLPNSVAWIEAACAALRAGAVLVPISHDATPAEIAYRLADAGCRAAIVSDERTGTVRGLLADAAHRQRPGHVGRRGRLPRRAARGAATAPAPDPPLLAEPAFIIYTSGTTGRAKGVVLTSAQHAVGHGRLLGTDLGLREDDDLLSPLPLFHSYGLNLCFPRRHRHRRERAYHGAFSTAEAARLLEAEAPTLFAGVPTMFHYLLLSGRRPRGAGGCALRSRPAPSCRPR